jgi:hypothetical protein
MIGGRPGAATAATAVTVTVAVTVTRHQRNPQSAMTSKYKDYAAMNALYRLLHGHYMPLMFQVIPTRFFLGQQLELEQEITGYIEPI